MRGFRKIMFISYRSLFIFTLNGMLLFLSLSADGQETRRVSVDQDRPLTHAIQQLAEQTKTLITFEELIFEYPDDLMDYENQRGEKKLIPKWGAFNFEYESGLPVREVLDAMLEKYQSEYPGNYRVVEGEAAFHVIPDTSRNSSGVYVARSSLLNGEVSLNSSISNAHELACDVVKQATAGSGENVACISDLAKLSRITLENFSTDHREARDVLVDILKQSGGKRSWLILRSITTGDYAISFIGQQNQ